MREGSTIVSDTGYGIAWEHHGRMFVSFSGSDTVYETTENETVDQFNYTLVQTLGSWGPTQEFRRYLESKNA